ncbi:21568_t:CDS:2 [Cetraspora pellucida]|uniref:21568_t:CDS:1 n=1 Tax=Cetraspora pellucida TaxID=1433469 RepID=A0A9N9AE94_9GLOM|nr:21568_t:CDS:2 [Cetraspora pellucida]
MTFRIIARFCVLRQITTIENIEQAIALLIVERILIHFPIDPLTIERFSIDPLMIERFSIHIQLQNMIF